MAARTKHDLAELQGLIEQSRIGEASALAHRLLFLDSAVQVNGHALPQVAAELVRAANALERLVATPLASHATAGDRLQRSRQLAMLGKPQAALEMLDGLSGPEAYDLRATVLESQGHWESAQAAYSLARRAWQSQSPCPEQAAGLLKAIKGVAYTQRKSVRYGEAEASYLELLALTPSADTHFLLAQFYEDSQQAEPARVHVRRAMDLAPAVYQHAGENLLKMLRVYHFGCLGVHRAETP